MASDKKCTACGTYNPQTAKFCRNCGNKFDTSTPNPKPPIEKKDDKTDDNSGCLIMAIIFIIGLIGGILSL
jgi:hypothetical protein